MTAYIYSNLTALSGQGLWSSLSPEASFLKDKTSYLPETDPRLPTHTFLETFVPNDSLTTSDMGVIPAVTGDKTGYLRIGPDVWSYQTANSTGVFGISPVTANASLYYQSGTLVSVLGIR
jgi:hypothetical protein